jgi:Phosphopantetheine attachment site
MNTGAVDACALLRAKLADRLNESTLDWLQDTRPLAAEGIASLDLIAVLARLQRDAGLTLPDDFMIDARTSLVSLAAALAASASPDASR